MDEYTVVERGSIIKINRSMDKYFPPLPEKQILENVNKSLDRGECGYNWIFYNCEHFVNRCRYGFARYNFLSSEQIFKLPVILNCIILVTEFLLRGQFISYLNIIFFTFSVITYLLRLQLLALLNWCNVMLLLFPYC
uniref:LRAT domain-containing protein n=1 Tax=Biomphalaria glabrata TaxID=6526 RepID=A0A2C9KPI0_BIOGL